MQIAATSSAPVELGVPYKDSTSVQNSKIVLEAVKARFPEWADQCQPYVNVLTLTAWNKRGYRVKKGEEAIRVTAKVPVRRRNEKTGDTEIVAFRRGTAYVFALPQVQKVA